MLSKTAKYAIRSIVYIGYKGSNKTIVGIKEMIDDLNIPPAFLKKILQDLSKNKLLVSFKGPNGGFKLSRDPKDVSLFDIVTIIDGPESYSNCILGRRDCNDHSIHQCFIHEDYFKIKMEWAKFLKRSTLEKVIADVDKEGGIHAI